METAALIPSRQSDQASAQARKLEKIYKTAKNPMIPLYIYAHKNIPISGTA